MNEARAAVARRLGEVRARIELATERAGRPKGSVRLVAVSKTQPAESITYAMAEGQVAFGENYAQELLEKATTPELSRVEWHFIGHLQRNKARLVARHASMVHSVDSVALAMALGRHRAEAELPPLRVLVELNVTGEASKTGAPVSALPAIVEAVQREPSLALSGLMTMPPSQDELGTKRAFDTLFSLRERLGLGSGGVELSMGMSADLEWAIERGATLVRVGTAIFGSR